MNPIYEIQQDEIDKAEGNTIHMVYVLGEYENNSVLAGGMYRRPVGDFPTLDEAKKNYPTAELVEPYRMEPPTMSDVDPNPRLTAECGECWSEDY